MGGSHYGQGNNINSSAMRGSASNVLPYDQSEKTYTRKTKNTSNIGMDTFDIQGNVGQSSSMFVKNQLNSKHMKKQNMNKTHDNVYSNN